MLPVGVVTSIVGVRVIVEGVEKHDPLNEGSILWITERQTPLGLIDEVFGQVKNPYYVVRYNSEKEVPEGIREGTLISFVAEFVNHVLNNKDLYKKGYDASGQYDEEVSDEEEFSDDEKEAEYKRLVKQNKRGRNNQSTDRRMENNRKQVPLKDGSITTMSIAHAGSSVAHGHCPPIQATGQGFIGAAHGHSSPLPCTRQSFFGSTNVNPPFPHANGGPNVFTTGVWPNGGTLPPQQSAMYPENTQISQQLPMQGIPLQQQLPMQGIPFQQQFNPSQRFPPPTTYPGGQLNMYADPMHAQGPINQNQWTPIPQFQAPMNFNPNHISGHQGVPWLQFNQPANINPNRIAGNQGGPSLQFNQPANINPNHIAGNQGGPPFQFNPPANFHSNHISGNQGGPPHQFNPPSNFHAVSISDNQHPPQFHHQFNPGAYDGPGRAFSASRGRRPFHRGGRGWRPAR
ncbi:Gar1/Naf1 RNA-binding region protein [Medicago truncatula]|nr:Gar1/Naf1 RNA-binding region protein [Medicago truncatula]